MYILYRFRVFIEYSFLFKPYFLHANVYVNKINLLYKSYFFES